MFLLKSAVVQLDELPAALNCLPHGSSGLDAAQTLALWRQWHQQGNLQIGRIDRVMADGTLAPQAMGITVWITDQAAEALSHAAVTPCTHRLYDAAARGLPWVMPAAEIRQAHDRGALNLMVLHFWTASDVTDPAFHPVFLQAHASFRDLHQGFGVQRMYQELPLTHAPLLAAAGMQTLHTSAGSAPGGLAWMGITREDANASPGSTLSFLFFSPPRRLNLKPAVQRMLTLAARQSTDDDIADMLGCSRDYVRKLWTDAYAMMENAGVLSPIPHHEPGASGPVRGRERRRAALEFLRANPHELRPGLATVARHHADQD